jgi:hypothetical protein
MTRMSIYKLTVSCQKGRWLETRSISRNRQGGDMYWSEKASFAARKGSGYDFNHEADSSLCFDIRASFAKWAVRSCPRPNKRNQKRNISRLTRKYNHLYNNHGIPETTVVGYSFSFEVNMSYRSSHFIQPS